MKTTLAFLLLLCTATVFAQSITSSSKPNTYTNKPKIGSKTDVRNPFDTTKVKAQAKNKETGWGDVGSAKEKKGYIGETEKNRNKAVKTNNLSDGDDPFGKTKPMKTNNFGDDEDPFGKTKKKNKPKRKMAMPIRK